MADDTPPSTPSPEAALAALKADRDARRKAVLDALRTALEANRCELVASVLAECGPDGVTRHRPAWDVEALS